jgi:hypothetical protein
MSILKQEYQEVCFESNYFCIEMRIEKEIYELFTWDTNDMSAHQAHPEQRKKQLFIGSILLSLGVLFLFSQPFAIDRFDYDAAWYYVM